MKRTYLLILALAALLVLAACQQQPSPTAVPPTDQPTNEPISPPTDTAVAPQTDTAVAQPTDTAVLQPTTPPEPTNEPTNTTNQPTTAQFPPAPIVNDEGGVVSITGVVTYTNPFFTLGVAEPVVILEDQAGFVDRDEHFLMPVASQALGQITSDFFESPFSYSLALPIEPQGSLRDVDNDGETDTGVQVFAVAYWTNTFGDPYLEERDLSGGGWSTAYASTRISEDAAKEREVVGGEYLVYAPDDQQGFPGGFGPDGLLFTADDPIVALPQGYTVVNMDTDPFTFDRARHQTIDLSEPEGAALDDYSALSYADAFDALIDQLKNEYAFTDYKGIDWEALRSQLRPQFEEADQKSSPDLYRTALRDLAWSIPDGHVSGPFIQDEFSFMNANGIGLVVKELDDGRFLTTWLLEDGPAAQAGIETGAEIIALDGVEMDTAVQNTIGWTGPYSTAHTERLAKTAFVTRFPVSASSVEVTFTNPGGSEETADVPTAFEQDSLFAALQDAIPTGFELPLDYQILEDSDLGYVQIYSFSDNALLTVQLWERLMRDLNENGVPGLIIDMRQNGGGSGFLADQMAAYFFNEAFSLGNTGRYDEDRGEFNFDPRGEGHFFLPTEDLRYNGKIAVLVGPDCASACEFFSYDMTINDRATIFGQYPTAGLGGSIKQVQMPENERFTFTAGRAVDGEGNIHIEGIGVVPAVRVPVTAESALGDVDTVLETAVAALQGTTTGSVREGGALAIGDSVDGELAAGERVRYTLDAKEGDLMSIFLEGQTATGTPLDTLLNIYDTDGNLLLSNDDLDNATTSSGFEQMQIPFDLTLVLEVSTPGDLGSGSYTLRIEQN
ncbi:MAG: S41 family peptidase [Candidatus Promineifilaceae bacterium]